MFLTALAAFGTHSRGALLGMGAMGAMLWWKSRQKLFMLLVVAAGASMTLLFMPQEWWDRMFTIQTYQEDQSAQGRIEAWTFAFKVGTSRFLGGGFEIFAGNTDAHSIYFEVLGEHGVVGLALFLALGLFTWMSASHIRRVTERTNDMVWMGTLARMTQVSIVAYASAGAFLGMAYFDYVYNLVLIVVVCKAILAARQASPQSAAALSPGTAPQFSAVSPGGQRRPSAA